MAGLECPVSECHEPVDMTVVEGFLDETRHQKRVISSGQSGVTDSDGECEIKCGRGQVV